MFNFFILTVGLIVNGAATGFRFGVPVNFLIGLFCLGAFLSLAFWFLDQRNVQLLETAEKVMQSIEQEVLYKSDSVSALYTKKQLPFNSSTFPEINLPKVPLAILWREQLEDAWFENLKPMKKTLIDDRKMQYKALVRRVAWWRRHRFWIPGVQLAMVVIFLVAAIAVYTSPPSIRNDRMEVKIEEMPRNFLIEKLGSEPPVSQRSNSCDLPVTVAVDGFEVGRSMLPPGAGEKLASVVSHVKDCPTRVIELLGFTDATGPDRINKRLSFQRAEAVKRLLGSLGVHNTLITSTGELFSIETDNSSSVAANRRVEVRFWGKNEKPSIIPQSY